MATADVQDAAQQAVSLELVEATGRVVQWRAEVIRLQQKVEQLTSELAALQTKQSG